MSPGLKSSVPWTAWRCSGAPTCVQLHEDVVGFQVSVCDALLHQVSHPFQELQSHHGGQAGARAVPTKVLAQGTGVAAREGDRALATVHQDPEHLISY